MNCRVNRWGFVYEMSALATRESPDTDLPKVIFLQVNLASISRLQTHARLPTDTLQENCEASHNLEICSAASAGVEHCRDPGPWFPKRLSVGFNDRLEQ